MKNKITLTAFCCFSLIIQAQNVKKTMLRIPDTGQTQSFTNTFGEDNDYTINPPYYIVNKDGTVLDTVTGLMWQRVDGGEMTIEKARTYVATLNLGGFTDWRLPTVHEAFSILNLQKVNPAMDTSAFSYSGADYWWCVQTQLGDSSKVWEINAGGGTGAHPKLETISAGGTKKFHVRAVRDRISPTTIVHFTDNSNGTITDNLTNLVWQKIAITDSLTWENALKYKDTMTLGGFKDWRLPNIKELQSIEDVAFTNPAVNTTYFTNINSDAKLKKYWSSTSLPNQTDKAWYLDINPGLTTYELKTVRLKVLFVRGNVITNTPVSDVVSENSNLVVYPNPFASTITIKNKSDRDVFELRNDLGQLIYLGKNIEQQNFSNLSNGIYFLKVVGASSNAIKIVKH